MKIHLISYGDARYQKQRAYLKETALISSFFDELTIFSKEDIDPGFLEDFQDIFSFRKGGGYMIWKPYFIKKVLDALPEGDETYFDNFMRKCHEYPFWATRMGYFDV